MSIDQGFFVLPRSFVDENDISYNTDPVTFNVLCLPRIIIVSTETINNKYYYNFNNVIINSRDTVFGLYDNKYIFTNVPEEFAFGFLTQGKEQIVSYSGQYLINKNRTHIELGDSMDIDFCYGNVSLNILGDFNSLSIFSYKYGYMGGENKLVYSSICETENMFSRYSYEVHSEFLDIHDDHTICNIAPVDIGLVFRITPDKYSNFPINSDYLNRISIALEGYGGYSLEHILTPTIDHGVPPELPPPQEYDFTKTLQLNINTDILNLKLGLVRNSNGDIISSSFDNNLRKFNKNLISITAFDIFNNIDINQITHIGAFNGFFSNFIEKVNNYFGIGGFNNTLFGGINKPNSNHINDPVLYNKLMLISSLNKLNGFIKLPDIDCLLNYLVLSNIFENRPQDEEFSIKNGFLEGDEIFIKNGISIEYNLDILSNITTNNNIDIDLSLNDEFYQQNGTISPFNINNKLTTHLLLKLKDNI